MAKISHSTSKPLPGAPNLKRGPPAAIKYYLLAYNVLSTIGWSYVLFLTLAHLAGVTAEAPARAPASYLPASVAAYFPSFFRTASSTKHALEKHLSPALVPVLRRACTAYNAVGTTTLIVQSGAVLEVLHALAGWVRSPVATTASQVASRLYMVWGITYFFPATRADPRYASMVLSWALTEVVRYAFYASALRGAPPRALLWARYSLFVGLYLTGAGSEAALIYASLPPPAAALPAWVPRPRAVSALWGALRAPGSWDAVHAAFRAAMYVVWWFALYVLYTYMLKQRRNVLGPARAPGTKPKSL
ncbi:tyrosine phosphatase-like protein [Amylocystis lapponica]|nr:tyrosine phosphatase-like protein [Amylocystis lapponica]